MREGASFTRGPGVSSLEEAPGTACAAIEEINDLDHDPDDRGDELPPRPPVGIASLAVMVTATGTSHGIHLLPISAGLPFRLT